MGAAEIDIADLEADVAAITTGDPILAYTALPDKAAIGALRVDVASLAEDVAGVAVADPTLAFTALPNAARIEAVRREHAQNAVLWHTPDAARYGHMERRVDAAEESIADVAADVAAIAIGDPILAYSALPDKAAIAALRAELAGVMPVWATPDTARYGSLQYDVAGLTVDITGLSTTAAVQAQQIIALDRTVASLHPLRAQVAGLGSRVETVEDDVAAVADPLLAYTALPDKAAISALRERVTGAEEDIVDLAADLAAVSDPAVSHASSYGDLMAHKPVSILNTPECLLSITAQDQVLQVYLRDNTIAENRFTSSVNTSLTMGLASAPLHAKLAALDVRVESTVAAGEAESLLSLSALPDKALIRFLMEEVKTLRVEIAALYSDRAKLAHLENRLADMERLSWL